MLSIIGSWFLKTALGKFIKGSPYLVSGLLIGIVILGFVFYIRSLYSEIEKNKNLYEQEVAAHISTKVKLAESNAEIISLNTKLSLKLDSTENVLKQLEETKKAITDAKELDKQRTEIMNEAIPISETERNPDTKVVDSETRNKGIDLVNTLYDSLMF